MSGIPFTQYLLPDGRKRPQWIDMPSDIEALAETFISRGGWFECEMLGDMAMVSLTACMVVDDEPLDVEIEIVHNGPPVVDAVERLVRRAAARVKESA